VAIFLFFFLVRSDRNEAETKAPAMQEEPLRCCMRR
jgi:hypothetical protein